MANNLFVSYRAHEPAQDNAQLIRAMESVGKCMQVQESFWYISSQLNVAKAREVLLENINSQDTLIVIDASNNEFEMNRCLREQAESRLRRLWR